MDDTTRRLLHRLIRRTPTERLKTTLGNWDRLTMAQRQSLDVTQSKSALTEELLTICEKNGWTVKNVAELEMIHVIDNPNQGMWHAYRLMDPEDDACSVELTQFKERFKTHLSEVVRHVSVKTKKHTDEAIWIRIAWGDTFSRPNHLKPTYVVYHLQTPYVFVTSLTSKQKPLLSQALILSTKYRGFKDANLSGRKLAAIRDLLMKQYPLVFPTNFSSPVAEKDQTMSNPCIVKEQDGLEAKRLQMARRAFGDGVLPQLESAVYKLETKFKDQTNKIMTEREEPFRCVVKFTSTNLLESFRQCAASGIVSPPITPLFSSIPLKGKNYFALKDKTLGSSP